MTRELGARVGRAAADHNNHHNIAAGLLLRILLSDIESFSALLPNYLI